MVATTFSTDTPNLVTDLVRQNGVPGRNLKGGIGMGPQRQSQVGLHILGVKSQRFNVADKRSHPDSLQHADRHQIAGEGERLPESSGPIKLSAVVLWPPDFRGCKIIEHHWRVIDDCRRGNA